MNWTGGRLSRNISAKNAALTRQKQHFAKVQQNLQNGKKKRSPIKWSIFDFIVEDRERGQRESSVLHLLSPRVHNRERSQPLPPHHGYLISDSHAPQYCGEQSTLPRELPCSRHAVVNPIKREFSPEDDLYNASPPPGETKRQRHAPVPVSEMENFEEDQLQEESVSEKRRRLLCKGDWVGVNIQRPLPLAFKQEKNFGRRRKLMDGERLRHLQRPNQTHITSPFPLKNRLLSVQNTRRGESTDATRADVRISIGGRVIPPGISSSSAPRRLGSHSTIARNMSSTASSDAMLLDNEEATRHSSAPPIIDGSEPCTRRSEDTKGWANTPQKVQMKPNNNGSYEGEDAGIEWAGFSEDRDEIQSSLQEGNIRGYHNELQAREAIILPITELYETNKPGRLIFSSSSGSMHHPKPQSSRVSSLLRSGSSDIVGSSAAQVRKQKPVVPSSRILDNELWKTWAVPEDEEDDDVHFYSNEHHNRAMIVSPEICTAPTFKLLDSIDHSDDNGSSRLEAPDLTEEGCDIESESIVPQASRISSTRQRYQRDSESADYELVAMEERRSPPKSSDLPKGPGPTAYPVIQKTEEDVDAIWRKFVFGESSDEVDMAGRESRQSSFVSTGGKKNLSGISIQVQPSINTSSTSADETQLQEMTTPVMDSTTSTGGFHLAEESPWIRKATTWNKRSEIASTRYSPIIDGRTGVYVFKGPLLAPSSNIESASMVDQTTFSSSNPANSCSKYSFERPQKIMSTKPKPFVGQKPALEYSSDKMPLHPGRARFESGDQTDVKKSKTAGGYFSLMRSGE